MKTLEGTQTQTGGSQQEATSPAELRKYRLRWWTLAVVSVTLVIESLDETILNVALPTLQRELGASATGLQWMVNAYILVFGGLLLIMGALGDRFGRARMIQGGLVVFGVASLAGAYMDTTGQLIAARAVMGAGAAMMMPATLSIIVDLFKGTERAKAISIWAALAGIGLFLGPVQRDAGATPCRRRRSRFRLSDLGNQIHARGIEDGLADEDWNLGSGFGVCDEQQGTVRAPIEVHCHDPRGVDGARVWVDPHELTSAVRRAQVVPTWLRTSRDPQDPTIGPPFRTLDAFVHGYGFFTRSGADDADAVGRNTAHEAVALRALGRSTQVRNGHARATEPVTTSAMTASSPNRGLV